MLSQSIKTFFYYLVMINFCFCFQPTNKPVEVLEGDVLIFRNPCLHPGDLRLVRAVNHPRLSAYKNVVLFPATESCKSSLSDECSGGDLVMLVFPSIKKI
jgi:hypothetical protein